MRRRDRRRQETIDDIKDTARDQLAGGGPAGISMRAIARHLATTASAGHYYFPSRQALLDALIVGGFTSLAEALRTTCEGAAPRRPGEQWLAVCQTHRAWALDHQAEYLLLYGHDGACAVKERNRQVGQAFSSVVNVLFSIMRGAVAADEIDTERIEAAAPATLRRQLATWREENDGGGDLPDRASRAEMPVPGHPFPGPDRDRTDKMGHAMEAGPERIRCHLRRPVPGRRDLLTQPPETPLLR